VYTWADGSTYNGDWVDGMKHGRGLYMYANGDMYEGGYFKGMKHGYGAASWTNGSQYVGHWDSGREHGQGRYTTASGQCYTGTFKQVLARYVPVLVCMRACITDSGKTFRTSAHVALPAGRAHLHTLLQRALSGPTLWHRAAR
jgi:hypothetical protein